MTAPEQPQIYLITPPAFDLDGFPDRLARVLDSTPVATPGSVATGVSMSTGVIMHTPNSDTALDVHDSAGSDSQKIVTLSEVKRAIKI